MKNALNKSNGISLFPKKWLWILLIQIVSMFTFSMLVSLSIWLGALLHGICLWLIMPAAGFISSHYATRKGLLNYIAWLIPPTAQVFANLLLWGYSPSIAPVFFCGFVSLVGAAAGEVIKRRHKR